MEIQETKEEREARKANYMGLVARAAKGLITPEIWKEANDKWEGANLLHNE